MTFIRPSQMSDPNLRGSVSRFPRAQNPLSFPFQTPATQARSRESQKTQRDRSVRQIPIAASLAITQVKKSHNSTFSSISSCTHSISFSPSSLHFQAISPSSLLCTPPSPVRGAHNPGNNLLTQIRPYKVLKTRLDLE